MIDTELLNNTIKDRSVTLVGIAAQLGISREWLYRKLRGQRDFNLSEIDKLVEILKLTKQERDAIFFSEKQNNPSIKKG